MIQSNIERYMAMRKLKTEDYYGPVAWIICDACDQEASTCHLFSGEAGYICDACIADALLTDAIAQAINVALASTRFIGEYADIARDDVCQSLTTKIMNIIKGQN